MRTFTATALIALALVLLPSSTPAQVSLQVQLGLPLPPPTSLVVVQPGIQVVTGYPEEVFYTGGYYWLRRDETWYRSIHPRSGFVYVMPGRVPPGLTRLPPGHYRNYTKEQAKAERKARKAEAKAEGHGKKSGHDH